MSARQNIQTARQMYEAFGRGDVQAILDRVTDDVDWSTDAAIASAPGPELHLPPAAAQRLYRSLVVAGYSR